MLPSTMFNKTCIVYICVTLIICMYADVRTHAQTIDNFTGLVSKGTIPKQITTSSTTKYKVMETNASVETEGRFKKKQINKFNMEATFSIDRMMRNGLVLFNDPVSAYIGQVADNLLKHDPTTRSKLNFYAVRSSEVNAFATDRGDIFINIGLLTYLDTEAQVAFILAHEITHWKEKHSMDTFLEYQGIDQSSKGYRKKNDFSKLLKKSNYSKKIEGDADSEGLQLFFKSNYSPSSLEKVFDVMASAHAPYVNEPFDLSYLNTKSISLPETLLLEKVNEIKPYEDDEELSTHPGVKSRKAALNAKIAKANLSENKKDFQIGEQKFKDVKELAKFEVCKIALEEYDYPEALYYGAILSQKYPDNTFLESIKMKSLYGLAKIYGIADSSDIVSLGDSIQGELQQVYHLFGSFSDTEIRSLAAAHLWEYCEAHPKDEGMQLRLKDLMMEMGEEDEEAIDKLTGKTKDKDLMTAGIFSEQMKSTRFDKMIKEERPESEKITKKDLKKGFRLGAKKVMFVNPQYVSLNLRKPKSPVQFIEAENKQEELVKLIKENARRLKMTAKVMDVQSLKRNAKAAKFNDIITMEKWIEQKISLPEGMIPFNHNAATAIITENKVKHVAFMGGLALKEKVRKTEMAGAVLGTLFIFFAPAAIYNVASPNNKAMLYTIVIDADAQDVVMSSYNVMNQKDQTSVMNSNVYWMLHQMNSKPKK